MTRSIRRFIAGVVAIAAVYVAFAVWFTGRVSPHHVIVLRDVAPMNSAVIIQTGFGIALILALVIVAAIVGRTILR
jgi:hypothetical protein